MCLMLLNGTFKVPANVRREGRTSDDASLHDPLLWVMHKVFFMPILVKVHHCALVVKDCSFF